MVHKIVEYSPNMTTITLPEAEEIAKEDVQTASSVARAEKAEIVYTECPSAQALKPDSAPSLPKPFYPQEQLPSQQETTIGQTALDVYMELERATTDSLRSAKTRLERRAELFKGLNERQIEVQTEHIRAQQTSARWGFFKGVITCVAAAAAIVLGAYLLWPAAIGGILFMSAGATATATTSAWGWALIASGVMSIVGNEVLPKLGLYNEMAALFTDEKEKQAKLALYFQAGINIVSTILGVVGGIASASTLMTLVNSSSAIKVGQTSLHLASGGANLATGLAERNELLSEAKTRESDFEIASALREYKIEQQRIAQQVQSYNNGYLTFANFFKQLLNCFT